MLVIPFDRKLDWRRPPLVTLALVVANVLIFFLFQSDDPRRLERAIGYYYDSGLHALELPLYRDHLAATGDLEFVESFEPQLDDPDSPWLWRMLGDADFMQRLWTDEVITPTAPEYPEWRQQRAEFERLLTRTAIFGWGYIPAKPRWYAAFSHMFLHGDLGHLLGNMFFLFAVGFLVEGALGRVVYLAGYLVAGLGALGLYMLMEGASPVPLVGASGAISGLMGMYAMLFGRRRISFFYYVLVYFDYVKAPAVLLLGLWLGFELLQYFWLSPGSSVAYMAHVGGLLSGALIAAALKWMPRAVDQDYLAENDQSALRRARFEQAITHMERLDFAKAVPLLEQLLEQDPYDPDLLERLVACTRFHPAGEPYHRAVHRVLSLPGGDPVTDRLVVHTYRDYLATAKPRSRLTASVIRRLLPRFVRLRELPEVERLLGAVLKHPQAFPEAPTLLVQVANLLLKQQQPQRARHYFQLLLDRFPAAPEAAVARRVLQL